jgi:hypothetical protein
LNLFFEIVVFFPEKKGFEKEPNPFPENGYSKKDRQQELKKEAGTTWINI